MMEYGAILSAPPASWCEKLFLFQTGLNSATYWRHTMSHYVLICLKGSNPYRRCANAKEGYHVKLSALYPFDCVGPLCDTQLNKKGNNCYQRHSMTHTLSPSNGQGFCSFLHNDSTHIHQLCICDKKSSFFDQPPENDSFQPRLLLHLSPEASYLLIVHVNIFEQ